MPNSNERSFTITSKMWLWHGGKTSWHFLTIPEDESARIKFISSDRRVGFGSIRVQVTIGDTIWKTSLFPSKEIGAYILPIKASVRKNENIKEGCEVKCTINLIG